MQSKTSIDPIGFTNARVLTDAEINDVSGGFTAPQGTVTLSGGGNTVGSIHVRQEDVDGGVDF